MNNDEANKVRISTFYFDARINGNTHEETLAHVERLGYSHNDVFVDEEFVNGAVAMNNHIFKPFISNLNNANN